MIIKEQSFIYNTFKYNCKDRRYKKLPMVKSALSLGTSPITKLKYWKLKFYMQSAN